MTRDELIQRINDDKFNYFERIPKKYQDFETARLWISRSLGSLKDVPLHLVDDDVRIAAMTTRTFSNSGGFSTPSLGTILPSHTARYEEIALLGIERWDRNIWMVSNEFLTNDFLIKALMVNGDALLSTLDFDWNARRVPATEIGQDLIDLAVSRSPKYFGAFRKDQYTESAVRACISEHPIPYQNLYDSGCFPILLSMIKEGFWPRYSPKPDDLPDGIEKMMRMPEYRILYRAYVLQFPIEDVIAHMKSPEMKAELLNMYTANELAPQLKKSHLGRNKSFQARMLESELGL